MNMNCGDRERIFADGTAEEWHALEQHAESCAECTEEIQAWKSISFAARELHEEWPSPSLWPRIARGLGERQAAKPSHVQQWLAILRWQTLSWQTASVLLLLVVLAGSGAWLLLRKPVVNPVIDRQGLLKDSAVAEVDRAETAYVRAIDKLAAQARPQLADPSTPLLASYREKLLVLDSAIADLRAQTDQNPANAHLRRELLAMYQEKQDTLQQVLEEKR
jgi:hypothetical protein